MTPAEASQYDASNWVLIGSFVVLISTITYWNYQIKMYDREHPPVDGRPQRNPYRESSQTAYTVAFFLWAGLLMLAAYLSPAT